MSEPTNPTPPGEFQPVPPNTAGETPAPRKRRRLPIWIKGVGGLFVLIVLLVLLAPTIASTGPVRSLVLGKVNANLNGRVEVADWSLGWTSGARLSGLRVLDPAGQQIAGLSSLTTDLSILDILRGSYSIGDAVIDGLDFQLKREADGDFNFAKLAKADASEPDTPSSKVDSEKTAAESKKLPDISGRLTLRNSKGTYEDIVKRQTVQFASIDGSVNVPNINAPIENTLTVVAATQGQRGTLSIAGTVDAIENNEVIAQASVDESIKLEGLDASAVAALLPPGGIERMAGQTNAAVTIKMTAGQSGVVTAELKTTGFSASGPALKGDTFTARELSFVVPPTTIDMSPGFGDNWANWPIRTGGDKNQPITVTVAQEGYNDTLALAVNATPQSLMNVGENMKPGAGGEIGLNVAINLGGLAKKLPHVFPERDGRRLSTGRLEQSAQIKLNPDAATITQSLHLLDLALARADGTVEKLQPIRQELMVSTLGGGWAMPDLRDIRLALTSSFAKLEFTGKELTQLTGNATGDLAKAQRELGQILPMEGVTLGGTFDVDLKSAGDVTSKTAPIDFKLLATIIGLRLDGIGGLEQFQQGRTRVEAVAKVVRGNAGVEALDDVRLVAMSGKSENDLTLDAALTAAVKYVQTTQINPATNRLEPTRVANVPQFKIERANVNLPAAQRDFPGQFAGLNQSAIRLESGTISLSGTGSYASDTLSFDVKGGIHRLNLTQERKPLLRDYTLNLDAAGSHAAAGPSAGTRIARLAISDNQKMLELRAGQGGLVIPADDNGKPSGEVVLGADLKKLIDLSRAGELPADGPQLTSGRVDGTLQLAEAPGAEKLIALTGQLNASGITVKTEGEPIKDEKLAVTLSVRSDADFKQILVDQVTAVGRLLNARIHDTMIDNEAGNAPGAPPLAAVRKANAVIDVPRLGDVHALWLAINPPTPEAVKPEAIISAAPPRGSDVIGRRPTVKEPEKPVESTPQGQITGGSANIRVTVDHQGSEVVITPDVIAKAVTIGAGDVTKSIGDVELRTAIRFTPADNAPADATFLQGLRELTVPSLTAKLAGANVRLERPLVIKDPQAALAAFTSTTQPSARPSPTATLAAVLAGDINLSEFLSTLEAWNGAKPGTMYPYSGLAKIRQELSTGGGGAVSLVGRADISDFSTTTTAGGRFAEPRISLANNVNLDPGVDALQINDLSLAMETTGAVRLAAKGTIRELDTNRRLDNVAVNLEYDAEKLWNILRPILDPATGGKSLEEWTMSGKRSQRIVLSGTYPANDPNPIRFVTANGEFALEKLSGKGLDVSQLDVKFLLDKGMLRLEHAGQPTTAPARLPGEDPQLAVNLPPGAICNGGTLSLHGFSVDMNGEHPRLFTPDNHPLIRGASINPVFADSIIGRFVNPAFNDATQAKGLLDVTVVSCQGLAIDTAMQSPNPRQSGRAELRVSLTDLFLGQPELVSLISKIKPNALNENGFAGEVRDGRVVIEGGKVVSDLKFQVDKYAVGFNGGIGLAENKLINFFVNLPKELFAQIDDRFARVVPAEGYRIALTGTTDNWLQNASQSILPIIADLGIRAGIDSLLGGRSKRDKDTPSSDARSQPKPETPEDLLGGLLEDALGGDDKKETDAEKEARRERIRQERRAKEERERQAKEAAAKEAPPPPAQTEAPPLTKKERERLKKEKEQAEKERRRQEKQAQKEKP
jgi:hypothetical protein